MAEPATSLTLSTKFYGFVPVGTIVPWHKTLPGMPALPPGWVECSGQTLNDTESPLHDQQIPDINGQGWFVRGSTTSGNSQLADQAIPNHTHTHDLTLPNHTHTQRNFQLTTGSSAGFTGDGTMGSAQVTTDVTTSNPISLPAINGGITSSGASGTETRPKNISMVFIMRVK